MQQQTVWKRPSRVVEPNILFERDLRNLLNKLSEQFFTKISTKIVKLLQSITEVGTVELAVVIIWEKAVNEHTFVTLYSDLCSLIIKTLPQWSLDFKKLLMQKCQKGLATPNDSTDPEVCYKQQKLIKGNMKFISALFKNKILDENIVFFCLIGMTRNLTEEKIDNFCYLMNLVGNHLTSKPNVQRLMNEVNKGIKDEYSQRTKILFKNLTDNVKI